MAELTNPFGLTFTGAQPLQLGQQSPQFDILNTEVPTYISPLSSSSTNANFFGGNSTPGFKFTGNFGSGPTNPFTGFNWDTAAKWGSGAMQGLNLLGQFQGLGLAKKNLALQERAVNAQLAGNSAKARESIENRIAREYQNSDRNAGINSLQAREYAKPQVQAEMQRYGLV